MTFQVLEIRRSHRDASPSSASVGPPGFFFFFFCLIVICRFLILHIFIHHVARGMGRPSQTWRCDMYVYLAHNT